MGLVSQEPVLFNDTIRANIAYGKCGDATEAEIIAAAELANAHKFISSLQQVTYTLFNKKLYCKILNNYLSKHHKYKYAGL